MEMIVPLICLWLLIAGGLLPAEQQAGTPSLYRYGQAPQQGAPRFRMSVSPTCRGREWHS